MLNINDRSDGEREHEDEAEAWAAYHADERSLTGTEVLVSEWETFDEELEANPFTVKFDPPIVARVTSLDYRLLDDVGVWIIHPWVYLDAGEGRNGWVDGYAHMWKVTK